MKIRIRKSGRITPFQATISREDEYARRRREAAELTEAFSFIY
jgi:hypothetical protein